MAEAHVLVFPCPAQGHINSMLPFAAALLDTGVFVTFLHTDHNLRRASSVAGSPHLRFLSVPDGLPDDHPRSLGDMMELERSLREVGAVRYRALLASLSSAGRPSQDDSDGVDDDQSFPPVTCVVVDGLLTWAIDAAEELGVPALAFRTSSACSFLAYQTIPELVELGELPFPAGGDLDEPVRGVPGMESFLRRRDLPSLCRRSGGTGGVDLDPILHVFAEATAHSREVRALVFNTTASLEGPALAHIAPRMRNVFAVGPLHAMSSSAPAPASSLWSEDDGCIAWLDGQPDRSVVYVSLGSLAVIKHDQFAEFLSGLVAAGYPFLWVLRADTVAASKGQHTTPQGSIGAVGEDKARVVAWAPQRDVLRHRAVGCFLTHAGWNSTLEAAVEGVPMVCWPFFGDQLINSRNVGAVWRTGLDMKDVCDRAVVERMVREAMESDEVRSSAQKLARVVRRDVSEGGSSAREFQRLVRFIKELSMEGAKSDHQNQG
ncbi:hypothetical protein PAHAL_2G375900 [Panicum hallii]|jgi:hypothetical protein|uniref:Glycosyltransferase n=1 Tax=Panicum hallii TaxID=206008 RepID=A0A2S3H2H1_9POAL|nr:7-deoxyloganetic acid glucosyltransferase-like [Panicum hallii]PAN13969.1 hypothetical protein PAHAL_2G375900 [Panicum hallii]